MMKQFILIIILALLVMPLFSQNKTEKSSKATIIYRGDKDSNSSTYLGVVKKGDPARLRSELRNSAAYSGNVAVEKRGPNTDGDSYIRYLSKKSKNKKREKFRHLSDLHDVDEEKLLRGSEHQRKKYFEKKELIYTDKKSREAQKQKKKEKKVLSYGEFQQLGNEKPRVNNYLARNYRIKGKKLRKGKKFKYTAGPVSMVVKYKIKEGNVVRTYVDVVDGHLKPGSLYELKYHGAGTARQYYFEYLHQPQKRK